MQKPAVSVLTLPHVDRLAVDHKTQPQVKTDICRVPFINPPMYLKKSESQASKKQLNLSDFNNPNPVQNFHYWICWIKLPPFRSKIGAVRFFMMIVLKKLTH